MSRDTAFPKRFHVRPAKTQISLCIAQLDQSSQGTLWVTKAPKRLLVDSEDSDQPVRSLR